eukprot:IDg16835t1
MSVPDKYLAQGARPSSSNASITARTTAHPYRGAVAACTCMPAAARRFPRLVS